MSGRVAPGRDHGRAARVGALAALTGALILAGCSDDDGLADRQAAVAERGATVMPFDLEATTHVFTPTGDGGVQVVRADDPTDTEQVAAVRRHLEAEAHRFARGDFSDPARIHGMDMPGLQVLSRRADEVRIAYATLPDGAELRYRATDPALVEALHDWFDAQVMDHGAHAESGHR